jgi:hypothetical protein
MTSRDARDIATMSADELRTIILRLDPVGMTQTRLAETIRYWISGQRPIPREEVLLRLLLAKKITLEDIRKASGHG